MLKRFLVSFCYFVGLSVLSGAWAVAQEGGKPHISVAVDLVQLNVAVTDKKGNYITGLRPQDFAITEDRIPQEIATFGEGNESARSVLTATPSGGKPPAPSPEQQKDSGERVSAGELTPWLVVQAFSFSSTAATICTAGLSSRRMRSLISFAPWRARIEWPSIPIAGTFPEALFSPPIGRRFCGACVRRSPGTMRLSTTASC